MKTIAFEILPAIGAGTQKVSGSVRDLVLAIPCFMHHSIVPPRRVVNAVLRTGRVDAGMSGGCQWTPFELTADEYEELVRSFAPDSTSRVAPADVPDWVQTEDDWNIWMMEREHGIPAEEHRRLTAENTRLEREYREAQAKGDTDLVEERFVEAIQAGQRLSEFVMSRGRKPGLPGKGNS